VPALPERLFDRLAAAVTILGQLRGTRGNLVQGAARACNGASQMVDQHPWGAKSRASSVAFLPRFVGNLFEDDGVAHTHDLMDHTPMQALAMGGQLALFGRFAPPGDLVATALLPGGTPFAALLGPPLLVIAIGVGGPPLPLHAALQAADSSCIRSQLCAQRHEARLCLPWHDSDAGWSQVQADGVAAYGMLGLVMGHPFQDQLHVVALPLSVGTLSAWARGTASDQAGVLDWLCQTMADHRVVPVDNRPQLVVVPQQVARVSFFWFLHDKAQSGIVAFVLDAVQSPALALKADTFGHAQADAVEGPVGTGGERLGQHGIQVIG